MKKKTLFQQLAPLLLLSGLAPAVCAGGVSTITAQELQEAREARQVVLVIDIRTVTEYEQGHIPGAINIPHFAIEEKSLPAAGTVVAYGTGLGQIDERAAAAMLDSKQGIEVKLLAGGLAGWESAGLPTTHAKGLTEAHVPFITYSQLENAQGLGVVLADLRRPSEPRPFGAMTPTGSPRTDLRAAFPHARVVEPDTEAPIQSASPAGNRAAANEADVMRQLAGVNAARELIVLIDDGDGSAERTALKLRSAGNKRVVVLAGGETILQRAGRSGSHRVGYGLAEGETGPQQAQAEPGENLAPEGGYEQ